MIDQRRNQIRELINKNGEISVSEIKNTIGDVSEMTIRRDLSALEATGEIVRIRGGAKSVNFILLNKEGSFDKRIIENSEGKKIIAKKAMKYLPGQRSIYIDSGTTILYFSQVIESEDLSIITSAPDIALELYKQPGIQVTLTGGMIDKDTLTLTGPIAIQSLNNLNIDIAFMATSAFTLRSGFTCGHPHNAELKRLILKKARKTIMLMDHTKCGYNMLYTFAKLSDIDVLISDQDLPDNILEECKKENIIVV